MAPAAPGEGEGDAREFFAFGVRVVDFARKKTDHD